MASFVENFLITFGPSSIGNRSLQSSFKRQRQEVFILTFSDLGEVGVAVGDAARVPHHGVVAGEAVDGGELLLVGRHS